METDSDSYCDDWRGYEVTVSCRAMSRHFGKTEYAPFPEAIDGHIGSLVAEHRATGCTEEPRIYDALAEGIAAQEERAARSNSL